MARLVADVTAPDGTPFTVTLPEHYEHTVAVLGYMRLRRKLPKLNPNDEHEEEQFDRFKAWVVIGTAENESGAQKLIGCQGYRHVTEETVIVPITPRPAKTETAEQEVSV